MEIKLRDFPCFYYTSAKGKRNEQKKYYASVASMLGYSLREAAESSGFFISVSKGKLFDGKPFSEDELNACGKTITTATSCSVNFNRLFASQHKITSSCCVLCPLSPSYLNGRIRDEYIYLKGAIENPNYLSQHALEPSMLSACHSLTLGDDIGTYPIVPFNALLLEYLRSVDTIKQEKLHDDMVMKIKLHLDAVQFIDDILNELIETFVRTTLTQISNSTAEPVSEALMLEKYISLISPYTYTPPRNVLPITGSDETRSERKLKAKTISGQLGFEMLINESAESVIESSVVLEEEKNNILQEQGITSMEEVSFPDNGSNAFDFFNLLALQNSADFMKPENNTTVNTVSNNEPNDSGSSSELHSSDTSEESCLVDSNISPASYDDPVAPKDEHSSEETVPEYDECEFVTQFSESVPEDIEFEDMPTEEVDISVLTETTASDIIIEPSNVESCDDISSELNEVITVEHESAGVFTDEGFNACDEEISSLIAEPKVNIETDEIVKEENKKAELVLYSTDVCALCSIGASAAFYNNILRNAEATSYAFFLRCMSSHPGKDTFESLRNRYGCALCPKKGSTIPCVYQSLSFRSKEKNSAITPFFNKMFLPKISSDMLPYVNDCTDSQKINLINFISDACNETSISIECVECFGVKGLLFYVAGKFYFFNPAYGSSGFLKPLLSDATKTKFYSMNPIPVHECFYKMGFKQIRIESIAALFSTVHNLDVLAPVGLIFEGYMHRALLDDMYAHIMPYYCEVCEKLLARLQYNTRKEYDNGLRLEWALGKNKDISMIARGHENNVMGGCYLHYRITMRHFEDLNVPGHLCIVKINNDLSGQMKKKVFELTAGKIAASTSRVHEYTFLLALSFENIAYYSCYESNVFFDELMSCLRSAYREFFSDSPDVHVERIPFKY